MPERLRLTGLDRDWTVERNGSDVRILDADESVRVTPAPDGRFTADVGQASFRGAAARRGDDVWVTIAGQVFVFTAGRSSRHAGRAADRDALAVPMPATVVRVHVSPGQAVRQGDLLVALEAMKMELAIRAPRDAVVSAVDCRQGELVQPGRPLVELS
jgi:acetyl/propionyl-CoA carboxylase alpha subunit